MTGPEIPSAVGAAKALTSAAEKAVAEDEPLKAQLRDKAKDSPAMLAAAELHARRVAVKQEILLKLFEPIARLMGVQREYFMHDFAADLAKKTQEIPEDDLVSPKATVAAPTLQALGYSLDEPDLKEMYLNLLATAVDGRRSSNAHPSFAEVIRQLSGPEAHHLSKLLKGGLVPLVRFKRVDGEADGFTVLRQHVLNLRSASGEPIDDPSFAVYIDNWARLGLVTVSYTEFLTAPDAYAWVEERPELAELRRSHGSESVQITHDPGHLDPTAFGRRFAAAVLS